MDSTNNTFTSETKKLFSSWAGKYDSWVFRLYFERLYHRILEVLDSQGSTYFTSQASILDIACGTGEVIFRLAQKYPKVKFIGVDLTPEMVELAQAKTKHLSNVVIQQGDATKLSFSDNEFTVVLCSEAFHHFPQPKQTLREIYRVTKVGGLFLLVDPGSHSQLLTRIIALIAKTFEVNKQIYSQEELQLLLKQAGFMSRLYFEYFFNNFLVSVKPPSKRG
jgi:ubiquinone/menaquinone biosynthesis C-methylase UbiE